jgi:hypothetical protein
MSKSKPSASDNTPQKHRRPEKGVGKPRPSNDDVESAKEVALRQQSRRKPPKSGLSVVNAGDGKATMECPHSDSEVWVTRLRASFGTLSDDFLHGEIARIINALPEKDGSVGHLDAIIAVLDTVKPRDELEAMLIIQMAVAHALGMVKARNLALSKTIQQADSAALAMARLNKIYAGHYETLAKMRRGGQQKVTVEHVHVHAGGQAIVGNVEAGQRGGGGVSQRDEQPHATADVRALCFTPGATLPCQDPQRGAVPVPSGARAA